MKWYLNIAIKIDKSLCEITLGFVYVYVCIYIYA